jgi:tagaturonate reductase
LEKQHFTYHVLVAGIEDGQKVEEIRKITCVKQGISLPSDHSAFFGFASSPDVKWLISNVTEAGMVWKEEGEFEKFAESFAGRLTQWLYRRFESLPDAQTVILPCELLPKNGEILKDLVHRHSLKWNLPLLFSDWVNTQCRFFNSLVDRIVPGFPNHLTIPEKEKDAFLVQTEPYCFWAIEGEEADRNLLPFINSGAEVILNPSIEFYSLRKIRILNGLHTFMAAKGLLKGYETVGQYVGEKENLDELQLLLEKEIFPTLNTSSEVLQTYANKVIDRFKNPFVSHKLADISLNSIAKFKSRLAPIFNFHLQKSGALPEIASLGMVSLIVYYLRFPEKIRDTPEINSYFSQLDASQSELEVVTCVIRELFGFEGKERIESAYERLWNQG